MEKQSLLNEIIVKLNSDNPVKYLDIIYNLLICKTEKEAIIKLNKYKLKESTYNKYIELFEKNYPEQQEEIKFLKELYKKCQDYFGLNKKNKQKDLSVYLKSIKEIIESGYSVEEFCSMYGKYTLTQIDDMAKKIRLEYPDIYNEFINLCKNSSDKFYTYIKWVAIDIKHNSNFDIFDYYYYTRLNPVDFLTISKRILSKEQYQIVHPIVDKFLKVKDVKFNKKVELNGITIIKNIEITKEEKEKIFEFLDDNNMPYRSYKSALRKYVNGDYRLIEYIEQKGLIK